jgi:hypothetical protein
MQLITAIREPHRTKPGVSRNKHSQCGIDILIRHSDKTNGHTHAIARLRMSTHSAAAKASGKAISSMN